MSNYAQGIIFLSLKTGPSVIYSIEEGTVLLVVLYKKNNKKAIL